MMRQSLTWQGQRKRVGRKYPGEEKWRHRWQKLDVKGGNIWKREPESVNVGKESLSAYEPRWGEKVHVKKVNNYIMYNVLLAL